MGSSTLDQKLIRTIILSPLSFMLIAVPLGGIKKKTTTSFFFFFPFCSSVYLFLRLYRVVRAYSIYLSLTGYTHFLIVVKYTYKFFHFNNILMYNSVALNTFTLLCNHHPAPEFFHLQDWNLCPWNSNSPSLTLQPLATTILGTITMKLL